MSLSSLTTQEMLGAIREHTGAGRSPQVAKEAGVSQSTVSRWARGSKATHTRNELETLYRRVVGAAR